jgi:ribosomal protein L37E
MSGLLGRLFTRSDPHVIYECRRCGESVDSQTAECPVCGHGEISTYDVR